MDSRRDDPRHERALEHAARAMLVAVHRDGRTGRQGRGVRSAEAGAELRCEVDVHEPGDAEAAEQRSATLRAPDEARAHDRAALDLLVRPDLHLTADARVLVDDAVVADDAALPERHARFQRALTAVDRPVQLRPLADVAVAPHDRTVDDRADIDGDVIAQHGRTNDLDLRPDLDAVPQVDRSGEARRLVDLDVTIGEDARKELLA